MSSTNRFTISKVPSYEQVIKEKHSSEVLIGSVSFDEEDDDLSRKPKHPSKTTHSGIRTSTPGNSPAGSMEDLSSHSYLSGVSSRSRDLNVSNHQDGSQCLDFDVDQNQEVKSMASSHDPDAGINRSSDELDLLTPCFGAHSVPDLTSGLVTSRHTRYGASTTAKTHRPLRDYNAHPLIERCSSTHFYTSDPIPEPIKSHEIPLLPSKTPPQNEIHDGSLLSNTLVPESSKDDQERTSPLGMNCIKGLISMDFEIGEVELPIDTIQDGPKTPMSAASTSSKGPDISSDQSELKEEKIHPASEISSDVLIEEIYDAELNVDATKSDVSEEGTLFTVLTPSPKPDKSADSINGSLSSSTAELVQLIDSEEMEFDASEFKASSTPEDGRSLIMMNMKKGRGESAQGQSSDEELRSYMLSPPPSKLRMSSDKTFSRTSKRPSILKQKFSFPDFIRDPDEESQASARTNSKVTFHDKIQTTYFPQSNGGTQAKQSGSDCHDTWMNNNTEEHVSLELPRFTQNRPVHLTDMAEETSSWSDSRVPTLWEEPDLVTRSKPLSDTERKGKLHTSSLPAYLNTSEKKEYSSSKSTSAVTEKEVINFVKEIMNATRSVRDGAEWEPFARYKGKAVTPSKLHQKVESREETERATGRRDSVPSYTTPSKLLSSSVWDEGHEEGPSNNGESEEILLRVASTLISSLDSGIGSEVNSVPSLRKLLQDVEILEKKIPTVASAPVYSSASALLHKLLHRTKFKEKPSLTAAYLESLNCFEPVATDNSPHTSESDTSRSPSKPLNVNCPQSAPVVKLQHSDRPEAKIFLTDTILTKPAEQSDNHLSRYSIHEHWDRICSWLSLKEQDRMRYSSRRATKGSISSGYPDDSSIWSTENSQDTFILSPTEVSKQSYLDDDMQRSSGDVKERSKHRIPVAGSSPGSKSYVEGKQSSPPDESDATTQNQVLVNQAIVDMVNAVTLYEHQMSNKKSPKKKPKREEKKLSKGPSESSAEGTGQIKPPKPDPSSPPCPCQAITPYSPAQPQARSPCPDERSAGTDEIIREINDRLMKMKEADDNRYHDVVTQYYNQYSGTATGFGPKCVAISDRTKPDPSKLSVMISQYVHGKNLTEPHVGMDAKRGNGGAQGLDQIEHGAKLEMHDDKYEDPPVSLYYGHSPFRKQKTGASLPTSGAASPNRDKVLGGYTRKSSAGDVSKFLIEKEVMESQLRRLQVENSTLQTENKLLKEKYNRGQVRIAQLESQVRNTKQQALNMNEEISDKMSRYKRHARDRTEKDLFECQERVAELTRELELSKAEHATLQKQLTNSRRSADVLRSSNPSDRSRIIESFKVDIFSLKDEVKRAKQLLAESELSREQEAARRKETSAQIVKLTEMKALLQQQLETTCGGSVAEKQVKALERRLKITEDRLHQERADRASKLSDVEEKLINDNARLQVLEKELKRQLNREREKHRTVDQKFKDLRDENERLRVQLADKPIVDSSNISQRQGHKKHQVDEFKYLLDQIKRDDNLGPGQEHEIIWLLWQRKEALARQLKAWEIGLDEVKVEHGNITQGLKIIRDERGMLEDRISRYKDTLDDVSKEKEELEVLLKGKVKELTQANHNAVARVQNLEDLHTAITAENDSLRASLRMTCGNVTPNPKLSTAEAQVEQLKAKVLTMEANLEQKVRTARLLDTELESTRNRLSSKEAALEEALSEMNRLQSGHMDGQDLLDHKQQQIDKLNAEIRGLQTEIRLWQDKESAAKLDRSRLEEQVEELNKYKSRAKFTDDSKSLLAESEKLALETELHEKDNQVLKLSIKYNECENELQRSKRQHIASKQQTERLELQLDQLQSQVRQKIRSLERMASTESHHTAQLQALRENLTSANKELSEKTAQLRMLETENEHMKDRVSRKEFADTDSPFDGLGQSEVQRRMLDMERENAKRDLDRANTALNMIIKENTVLTSRVRELRQELVKERTQLCQITTDKVDIEQQLHLCCEERDTLQAERDRLKVDINKISSETNQSIYKLESDMNRSPTSDYESHYHSLTPEGKKIAVELGTVHRLLEAREKEAILLKDTIDRQKDELQSLNRKIELLHEENRSGRDNIDRLTNQLSLKIKEHASVSEANQSLASAKNQLQMEKLHLEKDVGQGGSEMERRLSELQELTRKLEKAEERFRDAERLLHQKDTSLVAMETELKHLNRNNNILESEKTHLKSQVDKINEELRSIRNTNTALEQRLSSEKSVVTEEKMSVRQLNQELTSTHRHVDSVKRDYEVALANLETERKNVQNLQTALQHAEDKMFELQDVVTNKEGEKDSLKNQLADYKNTVDQYKKDKQTLYQDVQELCRKLADKDDTITKVREKYNAAVDRLQKDFTAEKTNLTREKEKLELDLAKMKEEIEELTERLRRKDMQIEAYVRTNNDLDNERRVRHDCETQVLKLEADLKEARQTLDMLQMENKRKADENKHSQDVVEKSQTQLSQLKETYKTQREQLTREIHELRQTLSEDAHKHEVEKNQLKEHIATATAKLQSTEVSLASVTEYKATLHEDSKGLEKSVEALRGQLHEEITARKLAEQKYETYKYQAEDVRAKKSALDERNVELQAAYAKIEVELNVEKDKYNRLKQEVSDERSTSSNVEAHAQSLHIQVNELQAEVSSLRSQLESQKQNLQGKNKRLTLDMKQQTENFDKERSKLVMQIQQGSTDLESAREQVAIKNREHLKLQEEILSLEERYREASSSLKHVKESLRIEEQHREKLEFRNQELELRMKTRSEDDSDASRLDATRAEISKTMAEMKKKMELQLEQSKLSEKEMAAKHQQLIEEHKRKIANLDSALGQEQAMHLITKTQLSSVEEDNQRLRTQLQLARKRTSAPEERTKSRMEEINEIIARSQTRAQQMLATGAYSDDPLRSGGREMILSPIPMMHNISLISDGNKSMGSDDISKNN